MTTQRTYLTAASEILNLVDENPTEPLTFERRGIEQQIATIVEKASGLASDEDDSAYEVGYDEGYDVAKQDWYQTEKEYEDRIQELSDQVSYLEDKVETAFVQGLEAAGQNPDTAVRLS